MANNTWKNYTQKSTALSDNDEVMLLDSTDEKNKRGLMSKFWDYVVDKMSTAVISKLETNNKTIIGAINALYSDKLGGYTLLFSGIMSTEQSIKTLSDNISNYKFVYILAFSAGEDNVRGSSLVLKDIFKKKGSITVCWFSGSPTAIAVYYNDDTHVSVKTENGAVNTLHLYGMK